jgi:hypothetical protein
MSCSGVDVAVRTRPFDSLRSAAEMTLRIELARDTITADDNAIVAVHYYIVNGSQPTTFDNNPGFFRIRIENEGGSPIAPVRVAYPVTGFWGSTTLELPARAVLGQVIDLRCIQDRAGYAGDPIEPVDCLVMYQLNRPGMYRVIIEYDGPGYRWDTDSGTQQIVDSERQLADTASLIVRS